MYYYHILGIASMSSISNLFLSSFFNMSVNCIGVFLKIEVEKQISLYALKKKRWSEKWYFVSSKAKPLLVSWSSYREVQDLKSLFINIQLLTRFLISLLSTGLHIYCNLIGNEFFSYTTLDFMKHALHRLWEPAQSGGKFLAWKRESRINRHRTKRKLN